MRNANAQRANIMIRLSALQQAPAPHVSHAEIGGWPYFESEIRRTAIGEPTDSKGPRTENYNSGVVCFRNSLEGPQRR